DKRQQRGPAGALWVAAACAVSLLIVFAISPIHIVAAQQALDPTQKFEVASIKPCKEEPNTGNQRRQEYMMPSPGRVKIDCLTTERIIYFAYAGIGNLNSPLLNDHPSAEGHVRGGPGWVRADRFTIE